jgi:hypothetical protein
VNYIVPQRAAPVCWEPGSDGHSCGRRDDRNGSSWEGSKLRAAEQAGESPLTVRSARGAGVPRHELRRKRLMVPAVGTGEFGEVRLHLQRLPTARAPHLKSSTIPGGGAMVAGTQRW